jgi:restriction endonuclease S subunit
MPLQYELSLHPVPVLRISMSICRIQLGEVAEIFVGVPTKQSHLKEYGPFGNVLTVRALRDFGIDRYQLVRARLDDRDVAKYHAESGDLVLSARSTSLKMGIVPEDLSGVVINATLMAVRCSPDLDPRLLAAYLRHPDGEAALGAIAQSGTIQMNLTVNAVSKLQIPLPPIHVQRQMAEMLAAADQACESGIAAAHARRELARRIAFDGMLNQSRT